MTLKNSKGINLYKEGDRSIKKFKRLKWQEKEEGNKESVPESNDSDIKIFKMK